MTARDPYLRTADSGNDLASDQAAVPEHGMIIQLRPSGLARSPSIRHCLPHKMDGAPAGDWSPASPAPQLRLFDHAPASVGGRYGVRDRLGLLWACLELGCIVWHRSQPYRPRPVTETLKSCLIFRPVVFRRISPYGRHIWKTLLLDDENVSCDGMSGASPNIVPTWAFYGV
jgi:hypothetical protein